jgi:adenylate cyclase
VRGRLFEQSSKPSEAAKAEEAYKLSDSPYLQWPHLWLASAYAQLGQFEEARIEAAEVLRITPGFTIERYKRLTVYRDPKDAEHRLDGLRKAGLPER